jgi:2-amino-4-hydroxy-6-hydroxymethyldihydropteridine diphosphokinase
MTLVLISLGSNIEPRVQRIDDAVNILTKEVVQGASVSRYYETEPVGFTEQSAFINVCIVGSTNLSAHELRQSCSRIEQRLGRMHREQWHEREIDIDLVLFGTDIVDTPELSLPHPRFRDRAFVLVPAAEIAPHVIDPVTGLSVATLLEACSDTASVVVLDSNITHHS